MKVSVIVPMYNVEQYLGRCLDSLLDQTYKDYEIICVNDCSPDNSAEIAQQYAMRHPDKILYLENENNLGLGLTREHALRHASGDYILFVDSDDYVKNDYIERYISALDGDSADIVVGGYIRDVSGKLTEHKMSDSIWSSTTYAIACAKLFKRSFIQENNLGFTNVKCGEDIYFSLSAFYHQARVTVIDYAGYYYYFNVNSITGSMNPDKNHERIMIELFHTFVDNHDLSTISAERRYVIEYTYLANMINALVVFNRGCGIKRMREKYELSSETQNHSFRTISASAHRNL